MEKSFNIESSLLHLKLYCEKENFKGWDPYDGLNSKVFNFLPFSNNSYFRILWIQLFKKNPFNLRKLFIVKKGHNAKGIALFLSGYCNLYELSKKGNFIFGSENEILTKINHLSNLLIELKSEGYSGACWGYNFDWQSRAFFLPNKTPTVVATSFAVDALLSAYEITKNEKYKDYAISSADFVLRDLNRIDKGNGLFMFSYSPLDDRAVYNATLLGTKILSKIYYYTKDEIYKQAAFISASAVCKLQNTDGSFPHSDQVGNKWRDSFHTGFKIECLAVYAKYCNDQNFKKNIDEGINYWISNFFMSNGVPKYYDNIIYPIDLHCPAQMIPTLYNSGNLDKHQKLASKVIRWSIKNMQDKSKGCFYFQKHKFYTNKIIYSRWPNAWMFYSLSYYLLHENEKN